MSVSMAALPVKEIMTTDVIAVPKSMAVDEVAILLHERRITGLPVVDERGTVVGVLSEFDTLSREGATAGDIMTGPVIGVTAESSIEEALDLLIDRRIRRVPVLDGGRLVGIVSRSDLLRLFTRTRWTCERCGHFARGLTRPARCARCGSEQIALQRDVAGF